MKLAHLTEIAALLSSHHRLFVEDERRIPTRTAGDYYVTCRNRFNRWMSDLRDIEAGVAITNPDHLTGMCSRQNAAQTIAEQVLINEMLIRIWTVMLVARERCQHLDRLEPLAHNVFLGQLTVRHRALTVCLNDRGMRPESVIEIDKLRQSTERWTDLLNCSLMGRYDLWQYAFDETRAREFLRDRQEQQSIEHSSQAWVLILSGLRYSFPERGGLDAPLHNDDRRIVRLMLTSFPEDASDATFWMLSRMARARGSAE